MTAHSGVGSFFFSSRRRHTRLQGDWSSDVCSSDLRDRDGGLWVGPAGRGIVHIHHGRTDVFSELDGLSGDDIYDLFEDREGDIWVATINGLDRFHELPVVTYSRKQGLSDIPWGGVLA